MMYLYRCPHDRNWLFITFEMCFQSVLLLLIQYYVYIYKHADIYLTKYFTSSLEQKLRILIQQSEHYFEFTPIRHI